MSLVHHIWAEQVTENNMADNIVGGIFGITPEMYQQTRAAKDTATNLTAAQLTPGQLAGYYAMEAGTGLGRAVPGLLGVEDPQLKMIRDVQSMKGQFDVSTPEGLRKFAQALSAKGYTDLAMQAASQAAIIGQKLGENTNTLLASGKYTPESLGVYARTKNPADLQLIDKGLTGTTLEKVAGAEQNIQNLSSGNTEIDSWITKVDPKNPKVTFGPMSTLGGGASRLIGSPTDNALEQDKLRRFVAREAGLDKNSNEGVLGALQDLKDMKANTVKGLQTYVDTIKTKGKSTTSTAPTTPTGSPSIKALADKIREKNPGLTGYTDEQLVQLAQKQSRK
jgi:hypothetical protein